MKISKSELKIINAFCNLIVKYDLSQLTVSMIIDQSGITKGTFYKYFKNITEIITFMEHYIDDEIILNLKKRNIDKVTIDNFISAILPLIYKKREIIKIMYSENLNGIWQQFLEDQYTDLFFNYLFKNYDPTKYGISKTVACRFFIHNFLFLLEMWITEPIPQKPEEEKQIFLKLLNTPLSDLYSN